MQSVRVDCGWLPRPLLVACGEQAEVNITASIAAMTGSRPRRRWLSYSLRSLLLVATLLAIVLGRWANSAIEQRNAVATIRDHFRHNRCEYDYERGQVPNGAPGGIVSKRLSGKQPLDFKDFAMPAVERLQSNSGKSCF